MLSAGLFWPSTGQTQRGLKMLEQLELKILAGQSSSAGDSPAKTSALQEEGAVWLGNAPAFGGICKAHSLGIATIRHH